jgi:hypothetical protein
LVPTGCARKHHGPEAGDSVTNWLHTCADDGQCHGSASCLNHLCTLACSAPRADACSAIAASAVCKTSTTSACDVPCGTSAECSELGEAYVCRDGYCREGEQQDAPMSSEPSGEKRSGQLMGEPFASETSHPQGPGFRDDPITPGRHEEIALGGVFRLSDRATRASMPQVSWRDDVWIVSWALDFSSGSAPWHSELATVSRDGFLDTWRISEPQWSLGTQDEHGRMASLHRMDGENCALRIVDLERHARSDLQWKCGDELGATSSSSEGRYPTVTIAPIEGSDEWLVAWTALEHSQPAGIDGPSASGLPPGGVDALMIARYDPDQPGWSGGPWRFPFLIEAFPLQLYTAGGDAWVSAFFNDGSRLWRLHDLAQPEPVPPSFVAAASAPLRNTLYSRGDLFQIGDRTVLIEAGGRLQTSTIDANDTFSPPSAILAEGVNSMKGTALPELNQLAVCVIGSGGVRLLTLDEHGALVHGPIWIEEDAEAPTSGGRQALAMDCDLAWSGSELLVAWSTSEVRGPYVPPPGPEGVPDARVSARIVKLTASGPEL